MPQPSGAPADPAAPREGSVVLLVWAIVSQTVAPDLPSPAQDLE